MNLLKSSDGSLDGVTIITKGTAWTHFADMGVHHVQARLKFQVSPESILLSSKPLRADHLTTGRL